MESSKATALALVTLLGMLLVAQTDGARATALSLRPRKPVTQPVRCEPASTTPATSLDAPLSPDAPRNP
ncbi:MAG: hypothetical protein KF819_10720 [Labilithrix sp.]|nr:hypothetical protein [Labilithrix sp.]